MAEVDAERYVEVLRFYARQMALLDRLDLDGYLGTFTEDGVTHHVHHGKKLEGRAAMRAFAEAALPRYRENVPGTGTTTTRSSRTPTALSPSATARWSR